MFSIIVAISKNGIIGLNNQLIWNLPDDLKNFKNVTLNHKVVMGRKTYTSFKNPLPNRENLVVTHQTIDKQGFKRIDNLDSFIEENKDTEDEIFIIGGAQIYELFFQYTKKIYLTNVLKDFIGDTRLDLDLSDFKLISKTGNLINNGVKFNFEVYKRI